MTTTDQEPCRRRRAARGHRAAGPAPSATRTISWIYCGDTIDPVHAKYIAEWEAANPGWKVAPEVVGWAQCQDKATTLAAAGTPVAHGLCRLAHAEGVRRQRPDRPGADDRRGEGGLLSAHRRHRDLRRHPVGRADRLLDQGALLEQGPVQAGRPRPRDAAEDLGRRDRVRQADQGKDRHPGLRPVGQDLRQHHAPVPALGLHQQRPDHRRRRQHRDEQPRGARRARGLQGRWCPTPRKARPPTSRTRSAPSGSTARSP